MIDDVQESGDEMIDSIHVEGIGYDIFIM